MDEHILSYALTYSRMGLPVFPCAHKGKNPLTEHGFKDATTDLAVICKWWLKWNDANIGMPTGAASGLVVIDIDIKNNGQFGWQELVDKYGQIPHTAHSFTGNGMHLFFKHPGYAIKCSQSEIAHGVDVKADGGYVIMPPSIHPNGKSYGWELSSDIADIAPAPLPDWLVELLGKSDEIVQPAQKWCETAGDPIPEGKRNKTLASIAGYMQRAGIPGSAMYAALLEINNLRCRPPLQAQEIEGIVKSVSRYEPDTATVLCVEDKSDEILVGEEEDDTSEPSLCDPGQVPLALLRIPGFVNEFADYCMETAPYPNPVLSFGGSISALSWLSGRKVRDSGDNRTNLYILGLAHSSAGKDWPRKLNTKLAWQIGLGDSIGDKFASGEGIQDALFLTPNMLFQTDEIDGMLLSISKAKDARNESMMGTLLTLYSSGNTIFPMRRKAGKESAGFIDQPHLTIFGTAIPNHYYEALSERMLTNGFFARMLILESVTRGEGQEPSIRDIPPRILETAKWWADFIPGGRNGNLKQMHPVPAIVDHTDSAKALLAEIRRDADAHWRAAGERNDPVGTTVWGRVSETTRKLALLYAISADHKNPIISLDAVKWASEFTYHQTQRSLYMAAEYSSKNDFDAKCKELLRVLRTWRKKHGESPMPFWRINRKLAWNDREHLDVRTSLLNQRLIEFKSVPTSGSTQQLYRVL